MSEPTKEQVEKARALAQRIFDFHNGGEASLQVETDWIADILAAETAPLHEKIASLEKQLAMFDPAAIAAYGDKREAEGRALAPPAQTQQGLSEEGGARVTAEANEIGHLRKLLALRHGCSVADLYLDDGELQCSPCGIDFVRDAPAEIEAVWIRAGKAKLAAPSNLEKQPSPAAAPAQISEAQGFLTSGQRLDSSIAEHRQRLKVLFEENEARIAPDKALRSGLLDADRMADEHVALATARIPPLAALAGQPAPTEDREALRAAALEDAAQLMEGEGRHQVAARIRALAGSPAQRAQSIETPAIEKPEQGQLGKKGGG